MTWEFKRGEYDPEVGTTPVLVSFTIGDPAATTSVQFVVPEEVSRRMRDDLSTACGSGLQVASAVPEPNGVNVSYREGR